MAPSLGKLWTCPVQLLSSPEAQLVSKARGRVPSPTARSWWLVAAQKIQLGLV